MENAKVFSIISVDLSPDVTSVARRMRRHPGLSIYPTSNDLSCIDDILKALRKPCDAIVITEFQTAVHQTAMVISSLKGSGIALPAIYAIGDNPGINIARRPYSKPIKEASHRIDGFEFLYLSVGAGDGVVDAVLEEVLTRNRMIQEETAAEKLMNAIRIMRDPRSRMNGSMQNASSTLCERNAAPTLKGEMARANALGFTHDAKEEKIKFDGYDLGLSATESRILASLMSSGDRYTPYFGGDASALTRVRIKIWQLTKNHSGAKDITGSEFGKSLILHVSRVGYKLNFELLEMVAFALREGGFDGPIVLTNRRSHSTVPEVL